MALEELLVVGGIALVSAGIAALFLLPGGRVANNVQNGPPEPLMLMFVQDELHHATHSALRRFALMPGMHTWADLRQALKARFPELPENSETGAAGHLKIDAPDPTDDGTVELNWRDGICWVEVRDPEAGRPLARGNDPHAPAMQLCCDMMVDPAWEILPNGNVGWRNAACDKLLGTGSDAEKKEPIKLPNTGVSQRVEVRQGPDHTDWYDVETFDNPTARIRIAHKVTDLVKSEETQRSFVQTLSDTFAHLSIGLAIFEKNGQLSIFNPALLDLTGLQPSALVSRPTVLTFFDKLRDSRCMPEPKNYATWRRDISDMVSVAAEGRFQETWTLEDGRTFSVTGRPHADGGTAFMFEDISSEVTLTRNFRIEMAQYEILLDAVADAMVVFSATGVLTFCNAAYRRLWGHSPESAFADVTISDAINLWQEKLEGGIDWSVVTKSVNTMGHRPRREVRVTLQDGRALRCICSSVGTDATLIRFSQPTLARQAGKASSL